MPGDTRLSHPRSHFLVRYWVNGHPLALAANRKLAQVLHQGGPVTRMRRFAFQVELDPRALNLRDNDRLELQLMHCPQGWIWLQATETLRHLTDDRTLTTRISNRLRWRLP